MLEERDKQIKWKLVTADMVLAAFALAAACGLRRVMPGMDSEIDLATHFAMLPLFGMLLLPSLSYHGAYASPLRAAPLALTWSVARGLAVAFCFLFALIFTLKLNSISRGVLGIFAMLMFAGLLSLRLYAIWILNRSFQKESDLYKILIVGTGNRARQLVDSLRNVPARGVHIIGFLDAGTRAGELKVPESRVLGTAADIRSTLKRHVIDEVILAVTRELLTEVEIIVRACEEEGIKFRIMADLFDTHVSRVTLMEVAGLPLLTLEPVALDASQLFLKRLIDLAFSLTSLVLLFPFILVIAVAVRMDSPGPVFFRQKRVGFHKRQFEMIKFRSMFEGSESRIGELEHLNEAQGPNFKMTADPRITRIGRILRQTSLDELPQLFNVLKGEMSLVGPRPMSLRDVARFDQSIQRRRFSVKPGLTCLWQVSGRSNLPFSRWLELDLEYIDTWNLALDFKILLKTIPAVFSGEGAK